MKGEHDDLKVAVNKKKKKKKKLNTLLGTVKRVSKVGSGKINPCEASSATQQKLFISSIDR